MIFDYISPWSGEKDRIVLFKRKYNYNDRLAVTAETVQHEPFTTITVCLDFPLSLEDEGLAFIDTNNNPGIDKWLEDNKIASPTGHMGYSGYCDYPEYKFNLSMLEE